MTVPVDALDTDDDDDDATVETIGFNILPVLFASIAELFGLGNAALG